MSTFQFDRATFIDGCKTTPLHSFANALADAVDKQAHALKHGHLPTWQSAIDELPGTSACAFTITNGAVDIQYFCDNTTQAALTHALQNLMPWRKGPFRFGPVSIDTEWRSDWKWDRLVPHILPLQDKTVLDVGCGNGYHLWQMRNAGASTVLGIDPSLLYAKQFEATQHFLKDSKVQFLPLPMESLPPGMAIFDTVFSMGVLYHRRNPADHLTQLRHSMKSLGELVLETLIAPGDENDSLKIDGRYANMRNIYELPTVSTLCQWVEDAGFKDLTVADITATTQAEQRSTPWMTSYSLAQALDPNDDSKTIEGHPGPLRAVIVAKSP